MKKKIICMLIVAMTLFTTACSTPNPDEEMNLQDEIPQVLANAEYENLEILFDEIQYYNGQDLEVVKFSGYKEEDHRTYQEVMELYADEVFPDLLGVEEVDKELVFDVNSYVPKTEETPAHFEKYYADVVATIETYEKVPEIGYEDEENYRYIQYLANWVAGVSINQGVLGQYADSSSASQSMGVIEVEKTYDVRLDDLSDSYMLMDGEKTVAEAKAEMEAYFNEHYPIAERDNCIDNVICQISVGKIKGTEYYAFKATRTFSYNGIPFREMPTTNSVEGELAIMAECALCESDKVDITIGLINRYTTPEVVHVIDEYISFQEVMDRVAYYFTGETKFQLLYGGIEYRIHGISGGALQATPYWSFIAMNPNDSTMLKVYVDMETGETTHSDY